MGIFLPRQEILAPLGLVTQPNQYKQYPSGAMGVARNVTLRNPGELVQAPDIQELVSYGSVSQDIRKLVPSASIGAYGLQSQIYSMQFNQGTNTWQVFTAAGTPVDFTLIGSAVGAFSEFGYISVPLVAGRLIFNGNFGCVVTGNAPENSTSFREAGLTQPTISQISTTAGGNGWMSGGTAVAYAACFVRRYSDDYTLRSSPSPAMRFYLAVGIPGPYDIDIVIDWASSLIILPGDIVELYRTDLLPTSSPYADPGATFKLVAEHTITLAEAGATLLVITDTQRPIFGSNQTPGRELYTNPGVDGALYANYRPPIAKCSASFKGFCFYGNTTERAQLVFSVPGGLGDQNEAAAAGMSVATFKAAGIGIRRGTGTVTNTSATITAIPAADIVGLKIGQAWVGGLGFPGPFNRIIAVGATTVTMDTPANANNTVFAFEDVIEINGSTRVIDSGYGLINSLQGTMEIECDQSVPTSPRFMLAFEFTLMLNKHPLNTALTVRATNGANYSPQVPEYTAAVKTIPTIVKRNRIAWSKEQQPEHCPSVSEDFAGFGDVVAMNATRDALWIWCSDGLFRLSGNGGAFGLGSWQIDYANSTVLIASPQASSVLNEMLYAYVNDGFVEIDSAGIVSSMTKKVVGDILPGAKFSATPYVIVEVNETNSEVLLLTGDQVVGSNTVYVFNTSQRGWTTLGGNAAPLSNITAMCMLRQPNTGVPRLVFGAYRGAGGLAPCYSGWNNPAAYLAWEAQYRPIYGDDPLELKEWMWADYLFDIASAGRNITPLWNGVQYGGVVDLQAIDTGAYARAGCVREVAMSQAIIPGIRGAASSTPARFQGVSVPVKQRTNQSKKR